MKNNISNKLKEYADLGIDIDDIEEIEVENHDSTNIDDLQQHLAKLPQIAEMTMPAPLPDPMNS